MEFTLFNKHNYIKAQRYRISFRVHIQNLISTDNAISIVMPIPLQNSYQKLIGQYEINPSTGRVQKENKFHNQYIYWNEILKPKDSRTFELNFKILIDLRNEPDNNSGDVSMFLKSDNHVNGKAVQSLSDKLLGYIQDPVKKVEILNNYVVQKLEYGNPIKGLYLIKQVLEDDKTDCGGFDVLLASLCLAQKIPARIISGFFAGYSDNGMHAWLEIYLPNQGWIVADPSIEKLSKQRRTKKFARLGFVGSDRVALSLGHNIQLKLGGKDFNLDILQNPEVFTSNGENSVRLETEFKSEKI